MRSETDAPGRKPLSRWVAIGLVGGAIVIVVGAGRLFPWTASAYYLERGGHRLNDPATTTSQQALEQQTWSTGV